MPKRQIGIWYTAPQAIVNTHDDRIYGDKHTHTPEKNPSVKPCCSDVVPWSSVCRLQEKHVDQMSVGPFVALLMACWCVEPLCLSITFEHIFKGFTVAVSNEIGVCPGVCECLQSISLKAAHLWVIYSSGKMMTRCSEYAHTGTNAHTRSLSLLENQILSQKDRLVFWLRTQTNFPLSIWKYKSCLLRLGSLFLELWWVQ